MNKQNSISYFRYLFSDKKSLPFWIFLFVFIAISAIVSTMANLSEKENIEFPIWDFIFVILFVIIFIGHYTLSYINYLSFRKFIKQLEMLNLKYIIKPIKVELFQVSFYAKFIQSHEVEINIKPKIDSYLMLKTDEKIILLGHVYDFGFIKRHIKPFLVSNMDIENDVLFQGVKKPGMQSIIKENRDLIVSFKKSHKGLTKIRLIDYG